MQVISWLCGNLDDTYICMSRVCETWRKGQDVLKRKPLRGSMDAGSHLGSAAKGSAIDLEVVGSGPVSCRFSVPSLSYHV